MSWRNILNLFLIMKANNKIFTWVEIPVTDFKRAKKFYESLLGLPIHESKIGEVLHGFWGHTENSVGGAIVMEGTPSKTGTIVYFDGGEDLNNYLSKINEFHSLFYLYYKPKLKKKVHSYS